MQPRGIQGRILGSPPGLPSTVRTSADTHRIMTLLPQRQGARFGGFFFFFTVMDEVLLYIRVSAAKWMKSQPLQDRTGEGRGRESRLILKPV